MTVREICDMTVNFIKVEDKNLVTKAGCMISVASLDPWKRRPLYGSRSP